VEQGRPKQPDIEVRRAMCTKYSHVTMSMSLRYVIQPITVLHTNIHNSTTHLDHCRTPAATTDKLVWTHCLNKSRYCGAADTPRPVRPANSDMVSLWVKLTRVQCAGPV
jgi:hypothetical protein